MSRLPTEAPARASTMLRAEPHSMSSGDVWTRWRPGFLRRFHRPHVLFVQSDGVWFWDARQDDERYAGRERRAGRRPQRHDTLAAWCETHRGSDVRLILSSRLTHQVVVRDRNLPLFEPADLERYARHQLVHYHGSAAADWPLAVWLAGAQRGASALHGIDMAACRSDAQRCGVRLRNVEPAWAVALRFARRETPALAHAMRAAVALVEGEQLCWLVLERGALVSLRQRMLAAPDLAALEALIDELRQEDEDVGAVYVIGHGIDADDVRGATLLGPLRAGPPSPDWWAA